MADDNTVRIRSLTDGRSGIEIVDLVDSARLLLLSDAPVSPTETPEFGDRVPVPLDLTKSVQVGQLRLPYVAGVIVHERQDGRLSQVDRAQQDEGLRLSEPRDCWLLELQSVPIRVYLVVDEPVTISYSDDSTQIAVGGESEIGIAARSFHESPAGTITTDGSVEQLLRAVSRFGSSLKTTSPERSWPTLRGHPPEIECGEEWDDDGIAPPATDVTIRVPPEREFLYPVASLAYYLGATVEPGATPELIAGDYVERLPPDSFEARVHDILRESVWIDSVVRSEGLYQIEVVQSDLVAELGLDHDVLYDAPLADRVAAYRRADDLDPDEWPAWPYAAHVHPHHTNAEYLPFAAADLALIHVPHSPHGLSNGPVSVPEPAPADGQTRGVSSDDGPTGGSPTPDSDDFRTTQNHPSVEPPGETIRPLDLGAIHDAWVGPGIPLGASKPTVDSRRRALAHEEDSGESLSVAIVCNDPAMDDEQVVSEIYGVREALEFNVTLKHQLTCEEFRSLLQADIDLLHYVGHIDQAGIACTDGYLDAREIDSVEVDAFLLNACQSVEQGLALVDAGALGGSITVEPVPNQSASKVGKQVSQLLNSGWTLESALEIVTETLPVSYRYSIVGNGGISLCQPSTGMPVAVTEQKMTNTSATFSISWRPRSGYDIGSVVRPHINEAEYTLSPTTDYQVTTDTDSYTTFLSYNQTPILDEEEIRWNRD